MKFDFSIFDEGNLTESYVQWLIDEQWYHINTHFQRLWDYYENRMQSVSPGRSRTAIESGRNYVQAQEVGLPPRITGAVYNSGSVTGCESVPDIQRKEVVIENDITWRINAMMDFLFGKDIHFISSAPDVTRRREIESILQAVFAANGGTGFFQDMAVLGSVYGFVDCVIRPGRTLAERFAHLQLHSDPTSSAISASIATASSSSSGFSEVLRLTADTGLELIEAPRALPVLDENDYRKINFYVQHFYQQNNSIQTEGGFWSHLPGVKPGNTDRKKTAVTEILGDNYFQRYENGELIAQGENPLGEIPVVHIQNLVQPYRYEGISDVEQLISLQDELNTRLSDRAARVTFQSFNMYLAKGIEGFENRPVSPGRMWSTDNLEASIEQFGGDGRTPGEDAHIAEIREAMDKISGVTPVVAGVIRDKLGHLTSAVALKMIFMGMLAKTARKQFTYGQGIKRIGQKVLKLLDRCGVYRTTEAERDFDVQFPNPLPTDESEKLNLAKAKLELGISRREVFRELGYEYSQTDASAIQNREASKE